MTASFNELKEECISVIQCVDMVNTISVQFMCIKQ
jgi:hypothetical protein